MSNREHSISIGNLNKSTTYNDLEFHIDGGRGGVHLTMPKALAGAPSDHCNKGFAFASFATSDEMRTAIRNLHRSRLDRYTLNVKDSKDPKEPKRREPRELGARSEPEARSEWDRSELDRLREAEEKARAARERFEERARAARVATPCAKFTELEARNALLERARAAQTERSNALLERACGHAEALLRTLRK